jgi:branched-chain amino acid transport system substrate-binding protein
MKARLNVPTLVIVLVVGLIFAGFAGSAYADKELKIGFLGPLSGPVAFAGKTMLNASIFAVDEINAAGGITVAGEPHKIKLISYDTKYATAPARSAAERLIFEDKVKFIIGATSLDTMAFQRVTEDAKVIILPVGGAIKASPKNPYSFRITTLVDAKYESIYKFIKAKMGNLKKVAFTNPDGPVGEGYAKMSRAAAKPLGFEVVAAEFVARGSSDFSPVLTKILAKKPDIIDLGATGGGSDSALIIKQARELGYDGLMVCAVGLQGKAVLQVAGPQAMEGIIETGISLDDPAVSAKYLKFAKAYKERFPKLPFIDLTSETYDSVYYFIRFLDGQKTLDTSVLKDRYAEYTWDGIFGKTYYGGLKTYGIKRQVVHPAYLSMWKNGKPVIVEVAPADVP